MMPLPRRKKRLPRAFVRVIRNPEERLPGEPRATDWEPLKLRHHIDNRGLAASDRAVRRQR